MLAEEKKQMLYQELMDTNLEYEGIFKNNFLKSSWIETPLGPMLAIANDESLYFLEFVDWKGLNQEIEKLRFKTKSTIIPGRCIPIQSIEKELALYFNGTLKEFKTPLHLFGTPFQRLVWNALTKIPYGETKSYSDQASSINKPSAFRAVANANGVNKIAIVIPCHRIINNNGKLGGYGGGIWRKQWLIDHERKNK